MAYTGIPYGGRLGSMGMRDYLQGSYRTMSKLDRNRAEMARNAFFSQELEKLLGGGGGVGQSAGASLHTAPGYGGGGGGFDMGQSAAERRMNPLMEQYLQQMIALNQMTGPSPYPQYAKGYNRNWWFGKGLGSTLMGGR